MGRILDLEYLQPDEAERLVDFGVGSTHRLLLVASHKKGREDLSRETGIDEDRLLHLVHLADIIRLKGIGSEYCELLDQVGVGTLDGLSQRDPERLHEDLSKLNDDHKIVRRLPSPDDVAAWVAQAKSTTSVVSD